MATSDACGVSFFTARFRGGRAHHPLTCGLTKNEPSASDMRRLAGLGIARKISAGFGLLVRRKVQAEKHVSVLKTFGPIRGQPYSCAPVRHVPLTIFASAWLVFAGSSNARFGRRVWLAAQDCQQATLLRCPDFFPAQCAFRLRDRAQPLGFQRGKL